MVAGVEWRGESYFLRLLSRGVTSKTRPLFMAAARFTFLWFLPLVLLALATSSPLSSAQPAAFTIDLRSEAQADDLAAFPVCVWSPTVLAGLTKRKAPGHVALAWVGFDGKPEHAAATVQVATKAVARGFDGVVLDGGAGLLPARGEDWLGAAQAPAWAALVQQLRTALPPTAKILLRLRQSCPEGLAAATDGCFIEGLLSGYDMQAQAYGVGPPSTNEALRTQLKTAVTTGKLVLVRDYVPAENKAVARQVAAQITSLGAVPSVGTLDLAAGPLAPIREVPRTILVLYGVGQPDPTRAPFWPPETFTGQMLQMALEWMGYEVTYHDVATGLPPERLGREVCGIITDVRLELPYQAEEWYLAWLLDNQKRGVKLLFTGDYPFSREETLERLFAGLGLTGGPQVKEVRGAKFEVLDTSVMNRELLLAPRLNGLRNATAPQGSKVWLAITGEGEEGTFRCDSLYTAAWGGAALDPHLFFRTSAEDARLVFDPFAFLETLWPRGTFPVPDTTTRQGKRMFLSHIDGDGFTTLSKVQRGKTCAEIMRDHVLKRYPVPVTVSVIESEIKGMLKDQETSEVPAWEAQAREIFALPNVQVASHSFSHPFVWIPGDTEAAKGYTSLKLDFAQPERYPKIDLRREVEGSVRYINAILAPKDKPVETFLWSGNCKPNGATIRMAEALGLACMNGGNTMISRRTPGISAISPRDTFMDGAVQVFAPVQNEFVFTNGFNGPLYGGFRQVLQTFAMTESPRRLKPVSLYYHFYSAASADALKVLTDAYEWAQTQPFNHVTVRDYVSIAKDARRTRIYRLGDQRWLAVTDGQVQSFRVPASLGEPNAASSKGVRGSVLNEGERYIHTDGNALPELDFSGVGQTKGQ